MERPTNSKILIEDKGDILIVTVPERDYLQPPPCPLVLQWGSLLFLIASCIGFTVLGVLTFGFAITVITAGFMLVVLLIMIALDAIRNHVRTVRKRKYPVSDSESRGEASVIFYDNSYFTAEGTRWLHHPEMPPCWDVACHLGNDLFAVYIHRRFPPEVEVSKDDQANLWSYEIVCRNPEEAQWVLREIETFLMRFDTSTTNGTHTMTALPEARSLKPEA